MKTGTHGVFQWLEFDQDLQEFISQCPGVIVGRCVAITSIDSGSFVSSEEERAAGWTSSGGIAFSPIVESTATLPSGYCCGFDEWYIFRSQPLHLGSLCHTNIFESKIAPGTLFQFINFSGFRFSDLRMNAISDLFWEQMQWIQPESYVADSEDSLLFATRNPQLYDTVHEILAKIPSKNLCR